MQKTKFVFKSKTIIGVLIGVAMMLKMFFGIDIPETDFLPILENLDQMVEIGMAVASQVLIIWGRIKAKVPLHIFKK